MKTIIKTITQPEEVIDAFADSKGYQARIKNEDYIPAQGAEEIQDPEWEMPEDFNEVTGERPTVPNPDYIPAVGEPTIDNPISRVEYVSALFDQFALGLFATKAESDIRKAKNAEAEAEIQAVKEQLAQTITTEIK